MAAGSGLRGLRNLRADLSSERRLADRHRRQRRHCRRLKFACVTVAPSLGANVGTGPQQMSQPAGRSESCSSGSQSFEAPLRTRSADQIREVPAKASHLQTTRKLQAATTTTTTIRRNNKAHSLLLALEPEPSRPPWSARPGASSRQATSIQLDPISARSRSGSLTGQRSSEAGRSANSERPRSWLATLGPRLASIKFAPF